MMSSEKRPQNKTNMHSRNRNNSRYDLDALMIANPTLRQYVKPNKYGNDSVDFSDQAAVKVLNRALLDHYYGISFWEFPDKNLCPPIPGRADYIHYMADLLSQNDATQIPTGDCITCLDIGVGANCIYPIIGVTEYGWIFIGADIDPKSITSAKKIVRSNPSLIDSVECRLQRNRKNIFSGIIGADELIDMTICNPPFHASAADALKGTRRKVKNLSGKNSKRPQLNFAGVSNELICDGGEYAFIRTMINESKHYGKNVYWFSTLVSKEDNVKGIHKQLKKVGATNVEIIPMGTGNKVARIIAWTFLSNDEQKQWRTNRW